MKRVQEFTLRVYTSSWAWCRAIPLMIAVAGGALVIGVGRIAAGCSGTHVALSFNPTARRSATLACSVSTSTLHNSYWVDIVAALVYGTGLALVLLAWWRFGWRAPRQGSLTIARMVAAVPLVASLLDVTENLIAIGFVRVDSDHISLSNTTAAVLATLGTAKWILVAASLLAVVLTIYGAVRFRRLKLWGPDEDGRPKGGDPHSTRRAKEDQRVVDDQAVCLSGGGIRSAAFSWGAMAELENDERLTPSTTIYSVSGGGYAATSYSTRTFDVGSYLTVPRDGETVTPEPPYRFVRANRRYLDNLRGGFGRAVADALGRTVVNLSVIFAGLFIVTLPIGLLGRSSYGALDMHTPRDASPWTGIRPGAWWPVVLLLAVATLGLAVSFALTTGRKAVISAVKAGLALAGVVFVVMIGLPWLAREIPRSGDRDWKTLVPAFLVWLIGIGVALLKPKLPKLAIRLGGVITIGAMVYTAAWIIQRIALTSPSSRWLGVIALAAVGYLIVIDFTGIQWWSLHPLYRDRLAATFALKRADAGIKPQLWEEWARWSTIETNGRARHVVCAATHRAETTATGLRSIGFRFSDTGVDYHVPRIERGRVFVDQYHETAQWLDVATGANDVRPLSRRPNARSSVIGSAAMSGAAFNSAMGRQSKGSTDSLFAMLNLRLGVWLPNPRYQTHGDRGFPRAGLRYLFHEVLGKYDVEDPFIQVSDGGHWENLGLVEALRDRHKHIVVVDATGGKVAPSTAGPSGQGFASLHEAVDLARIELHVEVILDVSDMRPDPLTGRAPKNWAHGSIVYHSDAEHAWKTCSCPRGTLLFVKAVVCDTTPEDVLVHANVDRVFPDYSTADQFLSDNEFRSLVRLGQSAMHQALQLPGEG